MNQELETFLKEGVKRYLGAFEAYHEFKSRMPDRLADVVKKRVDWGDFVLPPKRRVNGETGRNAEYGHWSCAYFKVSLQKKQDVALEIGIWWAPPDLQHKVIFYAGVNEGPADVMKFTPSIKTPRIKAFDQPKNTWLYLLPQEPIDFDAEFNCLLDELLGQFH